LYQKIYYYDDFDRKRIIRWIHIIASIPIIGHIYGPVKTFPHTLVAIQWVHFLLIVLSGFGFGRALGEDMARKRNRL